MATLKKVIKVTKEQYNILSSGGRVGDYVGLNDDYIYLIEDNSEYVDVTTVDFPNVATYLDWDTTYTLGAVAGQHIRVTMPEAPVYSWSDIPDAPSTFPPSAHNHSAAEITSGTLVDARIPSLSANKITSGTFAVDRIPNIPLSKITDVSNIGTTAVSTKTISTNSASIASGNTDLVTGGAIYSYVENEGGKVKSIKVNNTTYNPENGVITLPTYPSVSDSVITIKQAGISDQTFTLNGSAKTITLVDKDTTYSAGSGLTLDGTTFKHSNSVTIQNAQAVYPIKIDAQGHISAYGSAVTSMPASDVYSWAKAADKPSYNLSEINNRQQAYIGWGGPALYADASPLEVATIDDLGHNKFAFASAGTVVVQYSRDGGTTWIDYGASNDARRSLVTLSNEFQIGARSSASNTTSDKLRVILNSNYAGGNVYCSLRRLLINLSTAGSGGCTVKAEYRTIGNYKNNVNTWSEFGTWSVGGWSGWNSIPCSGAFGGPANQTDQIAQIRLTFGVTSVSSTYGNLVVYSIRAIGFPLWQSPSTMASTGHLYTFDIGQNAGFPANVNAVTFSENGTQLADKYATKSHTHTALSNRLALNPGSDSAQNSYNEGVRVNQASNGWANAVFGGSNGTTQGTGSGVWLVGRRGAAGSTSGAAGDFTIEHNGSNGTGLTLYQNGNRPRWNNNAFAYTTDIPTVNNATLTIQKNGTAIQTFSANASTNVTCNITVPTVITDLGGWSTIGTTAVDTLSITATVSSSSTSSQIPTAKAVWDVANAAGKVKEIQISGVTQTISSAGVVNLPAYPTTLPASDVSAWAKASNKPSYTAGEVGALPTGTTLDSIADGNSRKLANYLPLSGGTMGGTLKWNATSLPQQTSPQYFVCIDAFADGGTSKWASLANVKAALGSMPASDVSAWAKAANKPSYTLDEVSDGSSRKLSDYVTKAQFSFNSSTGVLTLINLG